MADISLPYARTDTARSRTNPASHLALRARSFKYSFNRQEFPYAL